MHMPEKNIFLLHSGDVLELSEKQGKIADHVEAGGLLVDGLGLGDVGNIVIRDRQKLAEDGIIIVVMTLEGRQVLAGPDIITRGFVYVRESEDLLDEAVSVVSDAVWETLAKKNADWNSIKNKVKDRLGDYVWIKTKRRPMILPIIMEVGG